MTEDLFMRFAALLAAAQFIPAVVFAAHSLNHRHMPFWRLAALGLLALFFASVLSAIRNGPPQPFFTFAANVIGAVGYFYCLQALRSLTKDRYLAQTDWILGYIYLAAVAFVHTLYNTYENRVVLVSLFIGTISIIIGLIAYRSRCQRRRKSRPLGGAKPGHLIRVLASAGRA